MRKTRSGYQEGINACDMLFFLRESRILNGALVKPLLDGLIL